jgi:uncharacterized protein YbdZ (MbtH family)
MERWMKGKEDEQVCFFTVPRGWRLTAINESNRIERSFFVCVVVGWIHSPWSDLDPT